jgi:ribosomal protein L31
MADIGDEIREYIANLASASAGAAQEQAANTMGKTNQFDAMAAQINALTDAVAKLEDAKENKDPNAGGGGGKNGEHDSRRPQMTKLRNMGAYCQSHGFHPVGADHDSVNCSWKKLEYKTKATWGNRLCGDMFWPSAKRVAVEQQYHPTWKGKAAPKA